MNMPPELNENIIAQLDEFVTLKLDELESYHSYRDEPPLILEVNTYRDIYRQARRVLPPQHSQLAYYKDKYLAVLMEYGYDMKGQWCGNGRYAEGAFLDALKVEPDLPLAHYRLGHTYYRYGHHAKAVEHFQQALRLRAANPKYALQPFHLDHAREVLTFCYLHLFRREASHLPEASNYPELRPVIERYANGLNLDKVCGIHRVMQNGQLSEAKPITTEEHRKLRQQIERESGLACLDLITLQPVFAYGYRELDLTHQRVNLDLLLFLFGQREDPQFATRNDAARKQVQRLREAFRVSLELEPPKLEFTREPGGPLQMRTELAVHLFTHVDQ